MSPPRSLVALVALSLLAAAIPISVGADAGTSGRDDTPLTSAERGESAFGAPSAPTASDASDASDGSDTADASAVGVSAPPPSARIAAAYPNPVRAGDAGESVTVVLPASGPGNWSLADGESIVPLNATGRVAVGSPPSAIRNRTNASAGVEVVAAPRLDLANGGERLELRRGGRVVDTVVYEDAPEGERWVRNATPEWRPLGYAPRDPVDLGRPNATAFVLPDASALPSKTLRGADRRLLLAGYTLTSRRAGEALVDAADRGVEVRVLVEAEPVGGLTRREAALLDRLVAAGVEVRALAGPGERFAYHHPKYAVVDDRALVLTENWKPAGTGGRSSRGWGVRLDGDRAAGALASLFRNDANGSGAVEWERYREGRSFEPSTPANGSFPSRVDPRTVPIDRARLLTAPGNAESAVVDVVDRATERVAVIQPTIGGPDQAMLRACVRAAERGVDVRILLSGAWYVAEENRRLAERLNGRADREDLPLAVRVAEPTGRFEKIHAKGVVADDAVVVGSLNWNDNSARENREVAVALRGDAVASYYRTVFGGDWRGGGGGDGTVPIGTLAAIVVAAGAAVALARRRVTFVGESGSTAEFGFAGVDFDGTVGIAGIDFAGVGFDRIPGIRGNEGEDGDGEGSEGGGPDS